MLNQDAGIKSFVLKVPTGNWAFIPALDVAVR